MTAMFPSYEEEVNVETNQN